MATWLSIFVATLAAVLVLAVMSANSAEDALATALSDHLLTEAAIAADDLRKVPVELLATLDGEHVERELASGARPPPAGERAARPRAPARRRPRAGVGWRLAGAVARSTTSSRVRRRRRGERAALPGPRGRPLPFGVCAAPRPRGLGGRDRGQRCEPARRRSTRAAPDVRLASPCSPQRVRSARSWRAGSCGRSRRWPDRSSASCPAIRPSSWRSPARAKYAASRQRRVASFRRSAIATTRSRWHTGRSSIR